MTNLFFSDLLILVNPRGDGTAGDSGVHTDMLLSVRSASETVGARQICSSQFSHLLETVGAMQTCFTQLVSFGESGDHTDIFLSVQSASSDSEGHADMLVSIQSASETVGPCRHAALS